MFPWKYFFDGKDQENTKTRGGKGQSRKIQKKQEGKNGGKKKKRFFTYVEVPILLLCSPLVGNVLRLPQEPLCVTLLKENFPLVWEPPLKQN
jgi:hypothetical protein